LRGRENLLRVMAAVFSRKKWDPFWEKIGKGTKARSTRCQTRRQSGGGGGGPNAAGVSATLSRIYPKPGTGKRGEGRTGREKVQGGGSTRSIGRQEVGEKKKGRGGGE